MSQDRKEGRILRLKAVEHHTSIEFEGLLRLGEKLNRIQLILFALLLAQVGIFAFFVTLLTKEGQ